MSNFWYHSFHVQAFEKAQWSNDSTHMLHYILESTDKRADGHYQLHYLPASRSCVVDKNYMYTSPEIV